MIFGIDVSAAQGVIDWGRVASEPCVSTHPRAHLADLRPAFAICKATEAQGYTDPTFARNVEQARALGLVVSAYHFLWGHRDPVQQAEHFARVGADAVTACPVLDFEGVYDSKTGGFADIAAIGPAAVLRCARLFGEATERLWDRPLVVYTGPGWMAQMPVGEDLDWLAARALWEAHYTDGEPMPVRGWGDRWSAHQFDGGKRTRLPTGQPIDGNVAHDLAWLDPFVRDTSPGLSWSPTEPPPALRLEPEEQATVQTVLDMIAGPPPPPSDTHPGTPTAIRRSSSSALKAVRPEEEG
jgi:lysozyme